MKAYPRQARARLRLDARSRLRQRLRPRAFFLFSLPAVLLSIAPVLCVSCGRPAAPGASVEPAASGQAVDAESLLFRRRLDSILAGDPYYRFLVDKSHSLPASYAPEDLVDLGARSYRVNKAGMQLRAAAAESLETMAAAAASEGIRLLVSSAYRSFDYQRTVYERNVSQLGQAAADRESARPGQSQHQLGLAVDFGTVDDSFYGTAQERWLAANAGRFGWSLSYPQDKEEITGYRWESWHYRYVGLSVGSFIDEYFQGIQQYALEFLSAYAVAAH